MAKPYAKAFYNSRAWRDARQLALHRDRYTCAYCAKRAEEVHHIIELSPENINDVNVTLNLDNLMSLCHNCHNRVTHGNGGDVQEGYCFDENGFVVEE